jgi:hypothetical protein
MTSDETQSSVRITNFQVYEKLMEMNAVQIEMVADIRGLKELPARVNAVEQEIARQEWVSKIAFVALGAGVTGFISAIFAILIR